jgi:glutamate/tyrosine decarboxylase-like PLP-dependent enzyme
MVLATSGHAAFDKAAHYFDVQARRVPVRPDGAADVGAMADAVDDDTVLVIGSAPSYPQGVIDPITDLGALAAERGILCHVDACLGGFLLPFLATLGHVTTSWDLAVPGVTSISADLHKYGYASKGVSVILYGDAALARLQPFVTSNWLGGLYGSPSMAGTRPGGPIAAGWAVLHYLGEDGYLRLAADAHRAAGKLRSTIEATPGIAVRGAPDATVLAFGDDGTGSVDTFSLGDALVERGGWFFDRQSPPDSLHATVHAGHAEVIDELCSDLADAVADVSGSGARAADRGTTYGTV